MDHILLVQAIITSVLLIGLLVTEILRFQAWKQHKDKQQDVQMLYHANIIREFSEITQGQLKIIGQLDVVNHAQTQTSEKLSMILQHQLGLTQMQTDVMEQFNAILGRQAQTVHELKLLISEVVRVRQAPLGDQFIKIITED